MCLWFVQMCHDCETFTPCPGRVPIECNNLECLRRNVNPNNLTKDQKRKLLSYDDICSPRCAANDCGLLSRLVYCGQLDALREYCPSNPSDSESDDDNWAINYFKNNKLILKT